MKKNSTMSWLEQIHQMKNRDIRTIEQSELQELHRMQWNTDCCRRKG